MWEGTEGAGGSLIKRNEFLNCIEYKVKMVGKSLKEQFAEIAPRLDLKPDRSKDKSKESKGKTERSKKVVHKKRIDKNDLFSRVKDKVNIKQFKKDEFGIDLQIILEKEKRNKERPLRRRLLLKNPPRRKPLRQLRNNLYD